MNDREKSREANQMGDTYRADAPSQLEPASSYHTDRMSDSGDGAGQPEFNYQRSVARLGGDAVLFREIVELFLEDAPALLVQAHRSLANGDATTLERSAHSLKGLAANLDALTVVAAAQSIEQHAQQKDLSLAGACLPELAKRLQALQAALAKFLAQDGEN
jgi:HPt (histidine-containing phosphotransfer) domain-containing protein